MKGKKQEKVDYRKVKPIDDINNAAHPIRQSAILILETIDDRLGYPKGLKGETWYALEDYIVNEILEHVKAWKK